MRNNLKAKLYVGCVLVGSGLAASSAFAAVDTTEIVSVIADAGTAGAAIGVAVLSMHYGIKLYKWIRGAG